jgi:diketogulonate reductase-like aldo/keto reductase
MLPDLTTPNLMSNENVAMPAMIYGTAWKQERTADLVKQALAAGFRGIDTAGQPRHYHEAGVGEALAELQAQGMQRDSIYLQTKFTPLSGQDPDNLPYDPKVEVAEQVRQSFTNSLQNLQTEYVDSLILHSPIKPMHELMSAWRSMERIKLSGGARQLGISNCYDLDVLKTMYQAAKVKPALVQNRFYADTRYDMELRAWCRERGIIYQSFWTLTANTHVFSSLQMGRLAERYQCEPTQILLRFVSQLGIIPLTGTSSPEHMRDDLAMFHFQLSEAEMELVCKALLTGSSLQEFLCNETAAAL